MYLSSVRLWCEIEEQGKVFEVGKVFERKSRSWVRFLS